MALFRQTLIRRGAATSNLFAPSHTGRWFNPPHQWTWSDFGVPFFMLFLSPAAICVFFYNSAYGAQYSHYQEKNYYDALPYTKEFIHKYNRLER
eukprot:CAMPEP_0176445584 /NCGR_PEP_ID=MMETSP0127-20121128/23798_1 /TAXON_ID=938130 /ORGANISM="Platyophrya macrostoma, Strain WH" /LENGTH=93 /DNA_ID=CAMNT_0017831417 /DNA_START=83 /DNA_END=360 /DNA_ORIENTATION=-